MRIYNVHCAFDLINIFSVVGCRINVMFAPTDDLLCLQNKWTKNVVVKKKQWKNPHPDFRKKNIFRENVPKLKKIGNGWDLKIEDLKCINCRKKIEQGICISNVMWNVNAGFCFLFYFSNDMMTMLLNDNGSQFFCTLVKKKKWLTFHVSSATLK